MAEVLVKVLAKVNIALVEAALVRLAMGLWEAYVRSRRTAAATG